MAGLAAERGKLRKALSNGHDGLRERLCVALSLPPGTTEEAVIAEFCEAGFGDEPGLSSAAAALASGSGTDQARGAVLASWLENAERRPQMLTSYCRVFLTGRGRDPQALYHRDAERAAGCGACAILAAEAERVKRFREMQRTAAQVDASCALIRLGGALMDVYGERKRAHGVLDYDDLVAIALDLLQRPGSRHGCSSSSTAASTTF